MKNLFKLFPAILLSLVFTAHASAQSFNGQNINVKFTPNGTEAPPAALTRPRIVALKNENKTEAKVEKIEPTAAKAAVSTVSLERKAFELINAKRAEQGLEPLTWSDDVAKIARLHSQNMAVYKFFSHTGLDGKLVNDRADLFGVSRWRAIGENIAYNRGYDDPVEFAVERWMLSASHKQNLLNERWKESAVGIAIADDGSYYFTQVFLQRK